MGLNLVHQILHRDVVCDESPTVGRFAAAASVLTSILAMVGPAAPSERSLGPGEKNEFNLKTAHVDIYVAEPRNQRRNPLAPKTSAPQ